MKCFFTILIILTFCISGCSPQASQPPTSVSAPNPSQSEDESTFQTLQDIEKSRIWDLVGTTVDTSKPPKNAQDEVDTVQKYTEYQLKDGGTLRINEWGLVSIISPSVTTDIRHKKDWDAIAKTIASELSLEDYQITKAELTNQLGYAYKIEWEKRNNEEENPSDLVAALFDTKTYQLYALHWYHEEENADEPKITQEQAVEIASARFDGTEAESVKFSYENPNVAVDTGRPIVLASVKRLAYVVYGPIKNGKARIKVDAMTGEIIASTTAICAIEPDASESSKAAASAK